jgi:hypothetical protein
MPAPFKERISKKTMIRMGAVAGFFDLANFIFEFLDGGTISGPIISIINWLIFTWWFWRKDVKFMKNPKMAKTFLFGLIWGFIPLLNALPEYAGTVIRLCVITRAEDLVKNKLNTENQKRKMEMEEYRRRATIIALNNTQNAGKQESQQEAA